MSNAHFISKYNVSKILLFAAVLIGLFTTLQLADAQKLMTREIAKSKRDLHSICNVR
jgi:hypothetical protein